MFRIALLAPLLALAPLAAQPAAPADTETPAPARPKFPDFGSAAPEFRPAFVIRGPIPQNFDDDTTRILGFFSTRLVSSLKAIPKLNDLHRDYATRGVSVIGVSVWEESATAVKDFLTVRGGALAFPVAFDGRDAGGTVSRLWQSDSGLDMTPYLFVVRRGVVLWHGPPEEFSPATLDAILSGAYDPAAAQARRRADETALAKAEPVADAIGELLADGKADAALAKCDELEKILPEKFRAQAHRLRAECFFEKNDAKSGFAALARFLAAHPDDAPLHARVALEIVSSPRLKERDFALANRCADRALALAPSEPFKLLKARVLYAAGDLAATKERLATLATPKNETVRAHLKLIREAVASRAPWPIPPNQDCACGAD